METINHNEPSSQKEEKPTIFITKGNVSIVIYKTLREEFTIYDNVP